MERNTTIRPAYDCIRVAPCVHGSDACSNGDAGQGHGVHNAVLIMSVRDDRAEITLDVGTRWYLPETPRPRWAKGAEPGAITIHTSFPQFDGAEPSGQKCSLWDPCYLDIGFSLAEEPTALLVKKGSDAVFGWLENFHAEVLESATVSR